MLLLYEVYEIIAENNLNSNLGGYSFRVNEGTKQVSTDGGNTWENFNRGYSVCESLGSGTNSPQTIDVSSYTDLDSFIILSISEASSYQYALNASKIVSVTNGEFEDLLSNNAFQWGTNVYGGFHFIKVTPNKNADSLSINFYEASRRVVKIIH